jgi:hypothetical protein
MWIRGYFFAGDYVVFTRADLNKTWFRDTRITLESGGGALGLVLWRFYAPAAQRREAHGWDCWSHSQLTISPVQRWHLDSWTSHWQLAGAGISHNLGETNLGNENTWALVIPDWMICLVALLPVTIWFRARRAPRVGHCRGCGYDLRASKERCPECGTAIPAGGPAAAAEAK